MYSHQIVHRVNWLLLTYQITGLAYISYFFSFSPVTQPYMLKINAYIAQRTTILISFLISTLHLQDHQEEV